MPRSLARNPLRLQKSPIVRSWQTTRTKTPQAPMSSSLQIKPTIAWETLFGNVRSVWEGISSRREDWPLSSRWKCKAYNSAECSQSNSDKQKIYQILSRSGLQSHHSSFHKCIYFILFFLACNFLKRIWAIIDNIFLLKKWELLMIFEQLNHYLYSRICTVYWQHIYDIILNISWWLYIDCIISII